jgi:hypothetical protein
MAAVTLVMVSMLFMAMFMTTSAVPDRVYNVVPVFVDMAIVMHWPVVIVVNHYWFRVIAIAECKGYGRAIISIPMTGVSSVAFHESDTGDKNKTGYDQSACF